MPVRIQPPAIYRCDFCTEEAPIRGIIVAHERRIHADQVLEARIQACMDDYKILNGEGPGGKMNWGYGDGYFHNSIKRKYLKKIRDQALKRLYGKGLYTAA